MLSSPPTAAGLVSGSPSLEKNKVFLEKNVFLKKMSSVSDCHSNMYAHDIKNGGKTWRIFYLVRAILILMMMMMIRTSALQIGLIGLTAVTTEPRILFLFVCCRWSEPAQWTAPWVLYQDMSLTRWHEEWKILTAKLRQLST